MSEQITGILVAEGTTATRQFDNENFGDQLCATINCRMFTVVELSHGIDVFIDDEGAISQEPVLNLPLTVLAHTLGNPTVLFGNGVVFGRDDQTGNTLELTLEQSHIVLSSIYGKPSQEVIDQICENMSFWPDVADYIRQVL